MGDMTILHGHACPNDLAACRDAAPSYDHGIMWSDPDRIVHRDEPYAVDNGAYTGFDPDAFDIMLTEVGGMPRDPMFVVLPDELNDWRETQARNKRWAHTLREEGYPYYAVGQPPAEPEAVAALADDIDAAGVFLGGGNRGWKFDTAKAIEDYPVHIGSPGLGANLRHADRIGVASIDTTSIVVHDYYHHLSFLEEQTGLS